MTQILHCIHHSQITNETNSNYGLSVIWWDKIFGSYNSTAIKSESDFDVGLADYPQANQNASLWGGLTMQLKNKGRTSRKIQITDGLSDQKANSINIELNS